MNIKTALAYDDVLLVPKYSSMSSRQHIDISTNLSTHFKLKIPFLSSPMDTVSGYEMCYSLMKIGGAGCLHRFMDIDTQCDIVKRLKDNSTESHIVKVWGDWSVPIIASIGVGDVALNNAVSLIQSGANLILVDVAHGHHSNVYSMVKKLIRFREVSKYQFDIIAGNVATKEGAQFLADSGVDSIRSLVGTGSLCTTRIETGHGVPSITSLQEVVSGAKEVPVIADGGIRYTGDIAKALACGVDVVMLGSLFAGTQETPGEFIESNGALYKRYRGSASLETKVNNNQPRRNVEGESTIIPYKGGVKFVIKKLEDGLRSAFSYSGASNIQEFWNNSEFIQITNAGMMESKPHLIK